MNAYLMAAGLATRLRPITDKTPKCLLEVAGIPMLEYWLSSILSANEFDDVFVNIHHLPNLVEKWIEDFKRRARKVYGSDAAESIKTIDERGKLLGTAGTLFYHGDMEQDFMVAYVDTFSAMFFQALPEMAKSWKDNPDNPIASLITFELPEDGSAGAIETDFLGTVTSFKEKSGKGLMGWAGMMFARKDFYGELTKDDTDLARDVFPRLCGRLRVMAHVEAYDIGKGIRDYEHRPNRKI